MKGIVYELRTYGSILEYGHGWHRDITEIYLPELEIAANMEAKGIAFKLSKKIARRRYEDAKKVGEIEIDANDANSLKRYIEENKKVEKIVRTYLRKTKKIFPPISKRKIKVVEIENWDDELRKYLHEYPANLPEVKAWEECWKVFSPVVKQDLKGIVHDYQNEKLLEEKLEEINQRIINDGPFIRWRGQGGKIFIAKKGEEYADAAYTYMIFGNKVVMKPEGFSNLRDGWPVARIDYE